MPSGWEEVPPGGLYFLQAPPPLTPLFRLLLPPHPFLGGGGASLTTCLPLEGGNTPHCLSSLCRLAPHTGVAGTHTPPPPIPSWDGGGPPHRLPSLRRCNRLVHPLAPPAPSPGGGAVWLYFLQPPNPPPSLSFTSLTLRGGTRQILMGYTILHTRVH